MLALLISILFFSFFIWMGTILLFISSASFLLIIWYISGIVICSLCYKEGNCKSLEGKDFVLTLLLVIAFLLILSYCNIQIFAITFWYLYLATFLSLSMYANSIRFKSLM